VLATLDAAAVLLEELPAEVQPPRHLFSADWLALGHVTVNVSLDRQLDVPIVDGVVLAGYAIARAPTGAPVIQAEPAVDVTLAWRLEGAWPSDLGISLRPTAKGAFIPDPSTGGIVQRDTSAPAQGLVERPPGTLMLDMLRVSMPAGADGVMLVVYRMIENRFENLLELPLLH
jgi:hypothetical protein